MANKAYKFRLYPTQEQKQLLAKTFGCIRFVYNKMLAERKAWLGIFCEANAHVKWGIGTYRLRILLDQDNEQTLGLRLNEIRTASAVYVNGDLVAQVGQPATALEQHQARRITRPIRFDNYSKQTYTKSKQRTAVIQESLLSWITAVIN